MKRLFLMLLCFSLSAFTTQACLADRLISVESQQLSFILNNLVQVGTYVDDMPWGVTIYKVVESGDVCHEYDIACPKEWLYIGISEVLLGPRQNLYKLAGSYGWQVKSVQYRSDLDKPDGCIDIKLVEKEADTKRKQWSYLPREICINLDHATVIR